MKKYIALFSTVLAVMVFAADASGEKLIAAWDFAKGSLKDTSGKFSGALRGKSALRDGKLVINIPEGDSAEGLLLDQVYPALSPDGGFRFEATFELNQPTSKQIYSILWDSKYLYYAKPEKDGRAHRGFAVGIERGKNGLSTPIAWLGMGDHSAFLRGRSVKLDNRRKYVLDFDFNGADRAEFRIDGALNAAVAVKKGSPIVPAVFKPVIGDRIGSTFNRFDGNIYSVRLFSRPKMYTNIGSTGRTAFRRNEKAACLTMTLRNMDKAPLRNIVLEPRVKQFDALKFADIKIDEVAPGKTREVRLPLETRLKRGNYDLLVRVKGTGQKAFDEVKSIRFSIAPETTDFMPVVMWGYYGPFQDLKKYGFTHAQRAFAGGIFNDPDNKALIADHYTLLDRMLEEDFRHMDYYTIPHIRKVQEQFPRYDREGNKRPGHNLEASNPEAVKLFSEVAGRVARAYGTHPAFDSVLINSEVRDSSNPSFGKHEPAAFRKFSGFDIPADVKSKTGPHYSRIPGFPASRVVPDNHPLLVYYRWFWKEGDGWNPVHSTIHHAYHKNIANPKFWTFFDPAVRTPPVWGSGGDVDYISHWTYSYPDPIRIGSVTDELRAMAKGKPGQGVMSMTQTICYRSATAPVNKKVDKTPEWVAKEAEAKYISIPPDFVRECVWTKVSRRLDGIMFHGYGSIFQPGNAKDYYRLTNPRAKDALKEVLSDVVTPLGPVLKRVPERASEVAVLQSFASNVFAQRGTWGWVSWLLDAHQMLQWARLDPSVIYEEEILRDGFGSIKVLGLFHCDVLPQAVFDKIREFQKKGGIIIGDEALVPGITPDIFVSSYNRTNSAEEDKNALVNRAEAIRGALERHYDAYADSDNPNLIPRVRSYKNSDCLFVINDKRTYGDYFGPWGMVMEKGLPNKGIVEVNRAAGAVYDLVKHRAVPFKVRDGKTSIEVAFTTNDGKAFLLLDQPVASLAISAPASVKAGAAGEFEVKVLDTAKKTVSAMMPLRIELFDADGKVLDGSGYAAAPDGVYRQAFTPALNDRDGMWKIRVTDLASGKIAERMVKVVR